jgi:hypothetical protein
MILAPRKAQQVTHCAPATHDIQVGQGKLREDSDQYYRDPNAARYPTYPLEPMIRAILTDNHSEGMILTPRKAQQVTHCAPATHDIQVGQGKVDFQDLPSSEKTRTSTIAIQMPHDTRRIHWNQ